MAEPGGMHKLTVYRAACPMVAFNHDDKF